MLPNFLIVGAARSGTTALFHYLSQHPQIYIPKQKECRFFSNMPRDMVGLDTSKAIQVLEDYRNSIIRDIKDYEALFDGVTKETAIGDISPDYLYYYDESIKNIKKYLSRDIKIIIILRNPIERAYSMYLLLKKQGLENLSFHDAIRSEAERIADNWAAGYHLVNVSSYFEQVKAYLENFSNVKIYLYDDLKEDALGLIKDIFFFLGIDSQFTPDITAKHNVSGVDGALAGKIYSWRIAQLSIRTYFWMRGCKDYIEAADRLTAELKIRKVPAMSSETRSFLRNIFYGDMKNLGKLIGRKLDHWV